MSFLHLTEVAEKSGIKVEYSICGRDRIITQHNFFHRDGIDFNGWDSEYRYDKDAIVAVFRVKQTVRDREYELGFDELLNKIK